MSELWETAGFQQLLSDLRDAPKPESTDDWPHESLMLLRDAGGLCWNIPAEFGGRGLSGSQMLTVYRRLASACLATTFILTQRNAACARMQTSANLLLKARLLPQLAEGRIFATVGISHLTTSRQHLRSPAVTVENGTSSDSFLLNGTVPWVTAGTQADVLVTGGTLADGRQILAAIPTDRAGVTVKPPIALMALSETQTGGVHLNNVAVSADELLHGPVAKVMSRGAGGGAGSLGTSAVAIGTAEGCLSRFAAEAERRPALNEFLCPLQREATELVDALNAAAAESAPLSTTVERLRQRANFLVIRSAQSWLAATKGAGFVAGHPAERAVRDSMFFLVWSCPQSVLDANLRELTCSIEVP
jgi:butyryl-CoA dehydrogenase